jgi:arabinogalactan endo-1,4-beta-galactosidase
VAVHVHCGGDPDRSLRFFRRLAAEGVHPDVLALTYYPFWNGPLAALENTLRALATEFGRPVLVAETSYPWTLRDADRGPNVVTGIEQLPEADRFPPTPAGQAGYFEALRGALQRVPGGLGAGFLVWEPAWLPGIEWEGGTGSHHDNCTLFRADGTALPALDGLRAP